MYKEENIPGLISASMTEKSKSEEDLVTKSTIKNKQRCCEDREKRIV